MRKRDGLRILTPCGRTQGNAMTDREWDRRLRIRTAGREDETGADYAPYEPTPYAVLERLARSGHIRRGDHVLDYGCGKGRVAIFLAKETGCRATGIDRSGKLVDMANANAASSGTADRAVFLCCPAERYAPRDENVFFFFNPFSEKIFGSVLRRLSRYAGEAGRALTVVCYYPSDEYISSLGAVPGMEPVDDIDCRDLFDGRNPREHIVVRRVPPLT